MSAFVPCIESNVNEANEGREDTDHGRTAAGKGRQAQGQHRRPRRMLRCNVARALQVPCFLQGVICSVYFQRDWGSSGATQLHSTGCPGQQLFYCLWRLSGVWLLGGKVEAKRAVCACILSIFQGARCSLLGTGWCTELPARAPVA